MIHELKILPQYFEAVQAGLKNFEIRIDDRNYKEGDTLILKEWFIGSDSANYNTETPQYYTGREITKEISYILKGGKYGLEEGYCIASLKQEGIILRNIDLTGISILEQIDKVKEEEKEFMIAIETGDKENAIEELFDDVQSKLGLLEKRFGIKADEVMRAYDKHILKIQDRPRKKG